MYKYIGKQTRPWKDASTQSVTPETFYYCDSPKIASTLSLQQVIIQLTTSNSELDETERHRPQKKTTAELQLQPAVTDKTRATVSASIFT